MSDFDDMIPEYVTESTELLADVESGFLALEAGDADDEVVNTIFRAIHSIKGGAGFVGLSKIEHLAHKMEDLLGLIRHQAMAATPPVTDALLTSLDVLRSLFDNIENMNEIDTQENIDALVRMLEGGASETARHEITTQAPVQEVSGLPKFEVDNYNLKNALRQGSVYHLRLDLAQLEKRGFDPMSMVSELLFMGEILDTILNMPEPDEKYEEISLKVDVLYGTVLEEDLLVVALHLQEGEYRQLSEHDFCLDQAPPAPAAPSPDPAAAVKKIASAPAAP
jgi:two-component system chemotaxis sensor kinase CheA